MKEKKPGTGGDIYIPFENRSGSESTVYFTRNLSPEGLIRIFDRVSGVLKGKVAVKLHTGEPEGPNIIPRPWVESLFRERLSENAAIVETNTLYEGGRYTTEEHRKTLRTNGWTFCPVDILDAGGVTTLPVNGGKWFSEMHVGANLLNYDSFLSLAHFKGHVKGGFGGSNKNIGIGCADGRIGKREIHSEPGSGDLWGVNNEELMEKITESTHSVTDYFSGSITFINVMRNMSVSCDCEGVEAEPVITPDVGILASHDILALDQACVDIVYNLPGGSGHALIERIESRHGLRQLTYMKELGLGNDRYVLVDIDNDDRILPLGDLTRSVGPRWIPDEYNTFAGRNDLGR